LYQLHHGLEQICAEHARLSRTVLSDEQTLLDIIKVSPTEMRMCITVVERIIFGATVVEAEHLVI
jgi:hypothetical protein